ncbi:MAG: primosomal protein N' [Chloroflexi bacterium]|nr:primosomal protein N' [Chloroflexota bacterium]
MAEQRNERFAEVAVDVPTAPGRTFSYRVPQGMGVSPGNLVRVPFGARTLQGIVFTLADHSQVADEDTRDISSVVFDEPLLDDVRLRLARWISEYYICSLFEAAVPMLPPGGRVRARIHLTIKEAEAESEQQNLTPLQQRIIDYISKRGSVTQDALVNSIGESAAASVASLIRRGILNRDYFLPDPSIRHRYRTLVSLAPETAKEIDEWLSTKRRNQAPKQSALVEHLREVHEPVDATEARKEFGGSVVKSLMDKGWLNSRTVAIDRDPLDGRSFPEPSTMRLNVEQSEAATAIHSAFEQPDVLGTTFLIEGVTGSGKTEVYLDAVDYCIQMGKQAIVLVPEIALTYQTIERFAARFPGRVAVLHSGLSDGERFDQWWKIRRGQYDLVIGSRSAVFAPVPDLGLIVIDEEHEWTYKQHDTAPRYHARQVSLRLSDMSQALVVLGSASPDVGSYYAGMNDRYRLHRLTKRFMDTDRGAGVDAAARTPTVGALPSVRVVDMREELRAGNTNMFSRALSDSLRACLDAGEQAMLFLNRRGTSSHLRCFSCGYSLRCRHCDVSVTYHAASRRYICHYCGRRRLPPGVCPQCLRPRLRNYGIGTEAVAAEVAARFPDAGVLRWDRDIASSPKAHEELLTRFRTGEAQVLVGTQMIAKGLHFPSVSLVGVVSADVGLTIPDYRAGERAFQLLHQVAGRAGRGSSEGKVIIQTFQPDNYAIQSAAAQDYQLFYMREMAYRRQQGNPPYSSLIRMLCTNTNQAKCESEAIRMATNLRERKAEWDFTDTEVMGPMPAFPARLRGRYRWHIILRGRNPRELLDKVEVPKGWSVDIDPVALT